MWLKDLPIDYGDAFNKLLWERSSRKFDPTTETAETRRDRIIHEARFTCTNCSLPHSAHVDEKCPFDATNFAGILSDEPGPLMKTWLLEYVRHPDVTVAEFKQYTEPHGS